MRFASILGFVFAALIARTALADGGNTAIVVSDQVPLRAAARDSAQQQAVLEHGPGQRGNACGIGPFLRSARAQAWSTLCQS